MSRMQRNGLEQAAVGLYATCLHRTLGPTGTAEARSGKTVNTATLPYQIGNQSTESLAGVCTVSTVQAGIPHTPVETLGQDFQDNKTRCTFSVFDSSVELKSQVHPQDELLQDHLVPPESSDEAPQGERAVEWNCGEDTGLETQQGCELLSDA
ncbi:hypothetical protein GW7_06248 [Heterocephalus glaber]|uniref:Uncharacterized protein n=1 Tax=Heterocephalus glaber TaxID=10181 RepID=G5BHJ4_HETGA|nr:hypothetical protein GW7_06248 [Heterocephalus glaber]